MSLFWHVISIDGTWWPTLSLIYFLIKRPLSRDDDGPWTRLP